MVNIACILSASPDEYKFTSSASVKGDYKVKTRSKFTDILILAASLILAFSLWIYAAGMNKTLVSAVFNAVPVEIRGEHTSLSVYSGGSATVDVTVQGTRQELNSIEASDIKAWADISNYDTAGRYSVSVNVTVPGSLYVLEQSVSTVLVTLDSKASTTVPVRAYLETFQIDSGGEIGSSDMTYDVSEVVVTGPETLLNTISYAQLPVRLGKVSTSQQYTNELKLIDSDGKTVVSPNITTTPSRVTVNIPIYFKKTVPLSIGVKYGYFNDRTAKISINPANVEIKGESDVLAKITEINLTTLDETKVLSDTVTQKISVPEGVINVSGTEEATISIDLISTETKELVVNDITINNPRDTNAVLLSDAIIVVLRGPAQYINYINSSNVSAVVDLSSVGNVTGEISVPVTVKVVDYYKDYVYAVGDYTMSVRIG